MKIRKQTDEKLSASKLLKIQKDLAVDVVLMPELYTPSTHLLVIFCQLDTKQSHRRQSET